MLPVPQDRTTGRRSSSIGCRSLIGRRTSTYIASQSSLAHTDPSKASHINLFLCFIKDLPTNILDIYDIIFSYTIMRLLNINIRFQENKIAFIFNNIVHMFSEKIIFGTDYMLIIQEI